MNRQPAIRAQRRIASWARVVAGLLALLLIPTALDIWHRASVSGHSWETTFVLVACALCFLIFGFVSVSGREPSLFGRYTDVIDRELAREVLREDSSWIGSQLFAIVPFGIATGLAFFFLAKDVVFENQTQTAWFVYCLFLLAWLVLMALFLVYSKYSFEKLKNQDSGQTDGEY